MAHAPEIDEADVPEADEEPEPPKAPVPTRTPPAKPDFVTAAFGVKSPIAPAKPQQPKNRRSMFPALPLEALWLTLSSASAR